MHLLNTSTLELEEFVGGKIPPYAILSHRWAEDELDFKEVSKKRANPQKQGYIKMATACRLAFRDFALQYLWIDTCCIDKKSSAELSEAINSMYHWYQNAAVCIVYLRDVEEVFNLPDCDTETTCSDSRLGSKSDSDLDIKTAVVPFHQSEWFSRAWTLQELLAPADSHFYNFKWNFLGSKSSLSSQLVHATGIPSEALSGVQMPEDFTFAEKMRWASRRYATREEDLTYSLIGLFNINMPMLYGEGDKAFVRFQEEFLKTTTDLTFLFWGIGSSDSRLLARSPADFAQPFSEVRVHMGLYELFSLNNLGLNVEVYLASYDWGIYGIQYHIDHHQQSHVLLLRRVPGTEYLCRIGNMIEDPNYHSMGKMNRRVTILRHSQPNEGPWIPDPSAFCGVRINPRGLIIEPEEHLPHSRASEWAIDSATGCHQCRFNYPLSDNTARMKFKFNHQLFFIEFYLDFDFVPYLYVTYSPTRRYHDIITIKDRTNLQWWQDCYPEMGFDMAIVGESDTGPCETGWIYRGSRLGSLGLDPNYTISLPILLSTIDSDCWIRLLPPSTKPHEPLLPWHKLPRPCWEIAITS